MSRTIHLYRRGHRFCMGLALSFLATAAAGEAAITERFQLYADCRPMRLVVENLSEDATAIGIKLEAIQAAAESPLRSARLFNTEADPFLYINVNVVGGGFAVRLEYNKRLHDPITDSRYSAPTWNINGAGTHGQDGEFILSLVSQYLDRFLPEFLRVNEEACGKR